MLTMLEKIVPNLLYPVPLFCELLIISIVLSFFGKKISGKIVFVIAIAFFVFCSYDFGQIMIAKPLESEFPLVNPLDHPGVKTVVVLGGGRYPVSDRPANAKLTNVSIARTVEGIRIFKLTKAKNIIFTGKDYRNNSSIAGLMKLLAVDLGVDEKKIITVDNAVNTREEAKFCTEILKEGDTVFLVTSAIHLKRAVKCFEKEGIAVIGMPTDFQVQKNEIIKNNPSIFFPNSYNLLMTQRSIHEYLGLLWEKIR